MLRLIRIVTLLAALPQSASAAQEPPVTPPPAAPADTIPPADVAPDSVPEEAPPLMVLIAMSDGERVVLRWGPGVPGRWLDGNVHGYMVERARIMDSPDASSGFEPLMPDPVRPWALATWEERVAPDNQWAAIAAEMLYGEVEVPVDPDLPILELRDRADLLRNRYGFALYAADMDTVAATGLGLRWVDTAVTPGADYLYRVYIADPMPPDTSGTPGEPLRSDTAYITIRVGHYGVIPPPPDLRTLGGDGRIALTWDQDPIVTFSGFHIERSEDGGESFQRLTDTSPFVYMESHGGPERPVFIDTTVVNYRPYRYRVYGITPFTILSAPAEVEAMARDYTPPPIPVIEEAVTVQETTVQLRWRLDEPPSDLAGFRIAISRQPDGPFDVDSEPPLPPTAREALDSRGISGIHNYYSVVAFDTAGNVSYATPVAVHAIDSIPPAPPTGLEAVIDSTGHLLITWDRGPEPDLLGWRIYRRNQEDHLPVLQTGEPRIFPYFEDSIPLRSLTRELYYDIVALDRSHNPSEATRLRVELPDIVPPAAPLLRAATPSESAVALAWVLSPSEDVERQVVLRRPEGDTVWAEIAAFDAEANDFDDTEVEVGESYEYTVVAMDSAGLRSEPSAPLSARPYGHALRPGVDDLRVEISGGVVHLSWSDPAHSGAERWFLIYRASGTAPLKRYATTEALEFTDRSITPGVSYRYVVQLVYRDGRRTEPSEERAITAQLPAPAGLDRATTSAPPSAH